jgi:hypothetical protein
MQDQQSTINLLANIYTSNSRQIERLLTLNAQVQSAIIALISETRNARQRNNSGSRDAEIRNALTSLINQNSQLTDASNTTMQSRWEESFLIPYRVPLNTPAVSRGNTPRRQSFFDPVAVFPTQEQINAATRTVRYGDIVSPTNTTCPISLDVLTDDMRVVMIRHCGHIFKEHEFGVWFRSNCRCPVCRYDLRTNTIPVQTETAVENTDAVTDNYAQIIIDISGNPTTHAWLANLFNPTT